MQEQTDAKPFGLWLIAQAGKDGMVGQLGTAAVADRRFPKHGTPDDVRRHLAAMQADGDTHAALDDAEIDWLAY